MGHRRYANQSSSIIFLGMEKFKTQETLGVSQFSVPRSWQYYRLLIHISYPKARNFYEKDAWNSS